MHDDTVGALGEQAFTAYNLMLQNQGQNGSGRQTDGSDTQDEGGSGDNGQPAGTETQDETGSGDNGQTAGTETQEGSPTVTQTSDYDALDTDQQTDEQLLTDSLPYPIAQDFEQALQNASGTDGSGSSGDAESSQNGNAISGELEAEYQRLTETPLLELTLTELEAREQIELGKIKEVLDSEKEAELAKVESEAEREFIEKMYDRKYEMAATNIEDQFTSLREAFDEIELIEKTGDTKNMKLTYENQSPLMKANLIGEQTETRVLVSSQDVANLYNEIIDANYGSEGALWLVDYSLGMVTQGISDMIDFDFSPSRSTDVFGRSLYIEKGYSIKKVSRELSGNNAWTEIEFFIYDNDENEIYHDCYIYLTYTD